MKIYYNMEFLIAAQNLGSKGKDMVMVLLLIYSVILEDHGTKLLKGILEDPSNLEQVWSCFHLQNEIICRTNT